MPPLGELHGVFAEMHEDLPDTGTISDEYAGCGRRIKQIYPNVLRRSLAPNFGRYIGKNQREIKSLQLQWQFASFQSREVQNVVDDSYKRLRRSADSSCIVLLLVI